MDIASDVATTVEIHHNPVGRLSEVQVMILNPEGLHGVPTVLEHFPIDLALRWFRHDDIEGEVGAQLLDHRRGVCRFLDGRQGLQTQQAFERSILRAQRRTSCIGDQVMFHREDRMHTP